MNIALHHLLYTYKNIGPKAIIQKPWFRKIIDKGVYGIGILGVIVIIPQIISVWIDQDASGVSLITWIGFLAGALFWLTYGIIHKEKPIIYANCIAIVADLAVIIGILKINYY